MAQKRITVVTKKALVGERISRQFSNRDYDLFLFFNQCTLYMHFRSFVQTTCNLLIGTVSRVTEAVHGPLVIIKCKRVI